MATARTSWSIPGVILFSHGELSYEVNLTRRLLEELTHSKVGERTLLAWERTAQKRLREVLIRSVPPTASRVPEALNRMRARLREEARLASYLQHPGIARILGIHEVAGVLYVVSEVVEGTSLNTLISYAFMGELHFSLAFCMYVGAEVASLLHHAHTRTDEKGAPLGIIHRDVNPARIYVGTDGEIILTDFARARSLLPGRVATTLPRPQGEVFYCSPEALLGEEMDPRSDLFSLGLVLLELATGRHPYLMDTARSGDLRKVLSPAAKEQVLHAAQVAQQEELPDYAEDCILRAATLSPLEVEQLTAPLPDPLRAVLRRLLQRKPEDRYPSAAALEAELRAGLAVLGAPYGASEALAELRASSDEGNMNRSVAAPRSESNPPPAVPLKNHPARPGRGK